MTRWPGMGWMRAPREGGRAFPLAASGRRLLQRTPVSGWRRWAWSAATAAMLVWLQAELLPVVPRIDADFPDAGEIADRDILAPVPFSAPMLAQDIEMRQMQAMMAEPPVLRRLGSPRRGALDRLSSWRDAIVRRAGQTELSLEQRADLVGLLFPELAAQDAARALAMPDPDGFFAAAETALRSVLDDGVVDVLPPGTYRQVRIVGAAGETVADASLLTAQDDVAARLQQALSAAGLGPEPAAWGGLLLRPLVLPNLVYSDEDTRAHRLAARQAVPVERSFLAGERVVEKGVRLTAQDALDLDALQAHLTARGEPGGGSRLWHQAARSTLVLGLLLLFGWIAALHFPQLLREPRRLVTATLLLGAVLFAGAACLARPVLGPFAVPITLLGMLATVLFRDRVGYAMTLLAVGLLCFHEAAGAAAAVAWLVMGLLAVTFMRRIRQRGQFYQAIAILAAAGVLLVGLERAAGGERAVGFLHEALVAALSPVASVALGLLLLPIVEPRVGVCSDLTLIELSDLNHPLLKRMALESQGTFHHSQVVGQLAENAARAVGANSLLTRVGALFHDIGKLSKPEYFVENQGGGPNKHDDLSPSLSTLVVAAHVKDGIALARQWRLPEAVVAFIPEHHGTHVMKFFYHKALQNESNETVKVDDFRYPGPKPRSRETAILMLADAVEAATRALAKPTPGRIREVVKQVADERMLCGELDHCGLTLKDIAAVREAFVPLLAGIHHARIPYPGQRERAESLNGRDWT